MKSRMWSLPPFYPCVNLTLLSFLKPPVLAAVTFFLWAVFFVCFLGARSWTQELTHARCVLWDGPPSTFLFLDYRSPNAFLSLVFCKLSSAWETSPCAFLLIGSSWQLACRLHVACLESLIVGLPSTVSSVILYYFLHIVYCCWKNLLIICFFFLFVVSFLLLECRSRRVEILNFLIIDVFPVFVKGTTSCQGLYYL